MKDKDNRVNIENIPEGADAVFSPERCAVVKISST